MEQIIKKNIFRQYDIRGKVPFELDLEAVRIIVSHFAETVKCELCSNCVTIVVGRDVRITSDKFAEIAINSILNAGCNVVDIGICPTPLTYFASFILKEADATLMITGSHNPPEYNGLKFSLNNDAFFGEKIRKLYEDVINKKTIITEKKGSYKKIDIKSVYFDWIERHFDGLKNKIDNFNKIKIVVDSSNGAASTVAPVILNKFGVETELLFCEEDGHFPNHLPDPTVEENIKTLKETVVNAKADFGVAFDGDADRIVFIDEKGRMLYGDESVYIFATDLKNKSDKKPLVILDVKSSQTIINILRNKDINVDIWKSGHSLIKSRLKELNADLAGETSSHIFFSDRFFGYDDAIYAMVRMLEIYVKKKFENESFRFSNFLSDLPQRFITPEIRIMCPDDKKFEIIEKIRRNFFTDRKKNILEVKEVITIDGLRLHFNDGWALIRASNTEPAITMRFESFSEEKLEYYKKYIMQMYSDACR